MTTLGSFYAQAAQAPIQYRRYALGAAYSLSERVWWGESITTARNRISSIPQYATALVAAGLDDDFAAVDSVPAFITGQLLQSNTSLQAATSLAAGGLA